MQDFGSLGKSNKVILQMSLTNFSRYSQSSNNGDRLSSCLSITSQMKSGSWEGKLSLRQKNNQHLNILLPWVYLCILILPLVWSDMEYKWCDNKGFLPLEINRSIEYIYPKLIAFPHNILNQQNILKLAYISWPQTHIRTLAFSQNALQIAVVNMLKIYCDKILNCICYNPRSKHSIWKLFKMFCCNAFLQHQRPSLG